MTDEYLQSGTYVNSFYSVIGCPSACKISVLNSRIHHNVNSNYFAPKILRESIKKTN